MVANLTPQYKEAEDKYRKAKTSAEKLIHLEEMYILLPKHKATEKMQADLKKKISDLKKVQVKEAKKASGPRKDVFHVDKAGAGQVLLLSTPNTGKSSLVNAMSRATLKVGEYPFTTHAPAPGMAPYKDIYIQILDMPPITADMVPTGYIGALRRADVIAIVIDLGEDEVLDNFEVCTNLLKEKAITCSTKTLQETQAETAEADGGQIKPVIIIATKKDLDEDGGNLEVFQELYDGNLEFFPVSESDPESLEKLTNHLFHLLDVVRVYSKIPGKSEETGDPFILPKGSLIADMCDVIHKDLAENMKFARVWGTSAKFPGQQVQKNHLLEDGDIVAIHD